MGSCSPLRELAQRGYSRADVLHAVWPSVFCGQSPSHPPSLVQGAYKSQILAVSKTWGVLSVGVLIIGALLVGVCIEALDFLETPITFKWKSHSNPQHPLCHPHVLPTASELTYMTYDGSGHNLDLQIPKLMDPVFAYTLYFAILGHCFGHFGT